MKKIAIIAAFVLAQWAWPSAAQTYIGSYQAWISGHDLVNSRGQVLDNVGQIIRQDRANFHRFGIRDAGDATDPWFHDAGAREILEVMVSNARLTRSQRMAIARGGVAVRVDVYSRDYRLSQVELMLMH